MDDLLAVLQCTSDQRRLLGGWRDILEDVRALCTSLNALPDRCACGNGASHLNGTCICCDTPHAGRVPVCADCGLLLAQLRPRVDTLIVDTIRFFPLVRTLRQDPQSASAPPSGEQVEHQIAAVMRMFDRLVVEAGEFQEGCRASHLRALKDTTAELLADAERLSARLERLP